MDIGVPSVRNLFRIKRERTLLWVAIGITSIPLHLLYNSAVYTTLAGNDFIVTVVTNNHFEQPTYSNMTEALLATYREVHNETDRPKDFAGGYDIRLWGDVLEGYNKNPQSYEDLAPAKCAKLYNTDLMSNHRNLFLITKHSSNTAHNNTLLGMIKVRVRGIPSSNWMCHSHIDFLSNVSGSHWCEPKDIASKTAKGLPWRVGVERRNDVEISGCKSEKTPEKCKVQFSLGIMIVVICCNLIKACCMVMAVARSREPTLVTLGDALDSFLRVPDQTTMGMCFADKRFIKREWMSGVRTIPEQWKVKGVQRWWTSVSRTRWVTCNFFCLMVVIAAGWSFQSGMVNDSAYLQTDITSMQTKRWTRGFGKVNSLSLVALDFRNITEATLLANLPQTILSFLYLAYNSLFTCMLSGHEWSLFSHHHRTLRVTSPRPGQRSTYWLQIPYTYAIPLMTLSGLLHWLTSQSIFLASVEISDPLGGEISSTISGVGYSCIAIIFVLILGILALLAAAGMGYRRFSAEITTVQSCSAAISAACHTRGEDPEVIIGKKVRWGDVGTVPDPG
ncbi:unnamed protein product, partial [Tuber aestivum]